MSCCGSSIGRGFVDNKSNFDRSRCDVTESMIRDLITVINRYKGKGKHKDHLNRATSWLKVSNCIKYKVYERFSKTVEREYTSYSK